MRDILGIETPLTFSRPAPRGMTGSAGIVSVIQAFKGPMEYLSGAGATLYMGDCEEFTEAGIPVIWSRHEAITGDSVLSLIFDYEDPLSVVLAEDDAPHEHTDEQTDRHAGRATIHHDFPRGAQQ